MHEPLNIVNFRDIHGYRNQYGESIRPGKVFRGAALDHVTAEEIGYLEDTLGIRYILDFRDEKEAAQSPDVPFPKAQYLRVGALNADNPKGFNFADLLSGSPSGEQVKFLRRYLLKGYALMPFDNEAYKVFFTLLLKNDGAIYFHCSAGKDRTGVCAMLFMLALGMGERDVIREYLLSNRYLKDVNRQFYKTHKVPWYLRQYLAPLMKVSRRSIKLSMGEIRKRYSGYDPFLEAEYGLDEAKRAILRGYYCQKDGA